MFNENIHYLELYEEVKEELKFLTNSEIRMNVLKYLSDSPITAKNICSISDLAYSAVLHNIRLLEDCGYLDSDGSQVWLNNVAVIKLLNFMNFKDSVSIVREYVDLWDDHDITCISSDDLSELSSLKRAYLIESV